jgi:hypothetical protein
VTKPNRRNTRRPARLPLALDRILALGEEASRYTEADLARRVGVSRERIRQLKAAGLLPHQPINSRRNVTPGYDWHTAQAFYSAIWQGIDRFVALVDARGDDECWPWLGYKSWRGSGLIRIKGTTHYAHRLAYEREHGPIPKGMHVVHRTGGIPCCNPRHLCLETPRERVHRWKRGIQQGACDGRMSGDMRAMTLARLRAIRRAYAKLPKVVVRQRNGRVFKRTPMGHSKALAERFGIRDMHVLSDLVTGKAGLWIAAD